MREKNIFQKLRNRDGKRMMCFVVLNCLVHCYKKEDNLEKRQVYGVNSRVTFVILY